MTAWQIIDSKPVVAVSPQLIALTGDIASGVLLSQLCYWFRPDKQGKTKLRVKKDGGLWLAKGRAAWEHECGLSEQQVYRARKKLESLDLVEVRQYKFNGERTNHWWLKVARLEELLQSYWSDQSNLTGQIKTSLPLTETTSEITTENYKSSCVPQTMSESVKIKQKQMEEVKEQQKKEFVQKPLPLLWKERVSELTKDTFVKPFTSKEQGQLKHINAVLGDDARVVVNWMLRNWHEFTHAVKGDKGWTDLPSVPQIGFACMHFEVARKKWLQSIAQEVQCAAHKLSLEQIQTPVIEPAPPDIPATPEELEKLYEDFYGSLKCP